MKAIKKYLAVIMTIFMIVSVCPATIFASTDESDVAEKIWNTGEEAPVPDLEEEIEPESIDTIIDASEPEMEAIIPDDTSDLNADGSSDENADVVVEETPEEIVGESVKVGDGVTATFDPVTGAVEFDSDEGTLWRNWIAVSGFDTDKIKSIYSTDVLNLPADSNSLFYELTNLESIDTIHFRTREVTDMRYMFYGCRNLKDVNMRNFNTAKVTTMTAAFYNCNSLTSLDLSNFDTSNVTDMYAMFFKCTSLTSLDLGYFDTSNLTSIDYMFFGCSNLRTLSLKNSDLSKVTNANQVFTNCNSLKLLQTPKKNRLEIEFPVTLYNKKGDNITKLPKGEQSVVLAQNKKLLDGTTVVGDLVTAAFDSSTDAVSFYSDRGTLWRRWRDNFGIDKLSFKSIRVSYGTMYLPPLSMLLFDSCRNLNDLNFSSFDTSNVTDMGYMFDNCDSLTDLDMSGLDTSNVTELNGMFFSCVSLSNLNFGNFNTSNVTTMFEMFNSCYSLKNLDLSSFDTSKVSDMSWMFIDCRDLRSLNLSNFDTSNVTGMIGMFLGCKSLTYLDLSSFDTSKVTDFKNLFTDCTSLEILCTPKKHIKSGVALPIPMYDVTGKKYTELPVLSKSIVLGKTQKIVQDFLNPALPTPSPKPSSLVFPDVRNPKNPYYKAIYWAADAGITKGYADGTFGIDKPCTRGEMMMFLWRYAGKPSPKTVSKSPFKDVPKTHTFYKAILWGSQRGITKGYSDGTFGIKRNVTRGECMMFLWRLKGKPSPKAVAKAPFPDVPKSHVFYNAVLWGYQKKITTGFTSGDLKGKFGVNENCSRGQIVTFLYRARAL